MENTLEFDMNEEQIAKLIENIIANAGYGRTAAQMAVTPLTIAIFAAAYEMGRNDKLQ